MLRADQMLENGSKPAVRHMVRAGTMVLRGSTPMCSYREANKIIAATPIAAL